MGTLRCTSIPQSVGRGRGARHLRSILKVKLEAPVMHTIERGEEESFWLRTFEVAKVLVESHPNHCRAELVTPLLLRSSALRIFFGSAVSHPRLTL